MFFTQGGYVYFSTLKRLQTATCMKPHSLQVKNVIFGLKDNKFERFKDGDWSCLQVILERDYKCFTPSLKAIANSFLKIGERFLCDHGKRRYWLVFIIYYVHHIIYISALHRRNIRFNKTGKKGPGNSSRGNLGSRHNNVKRSMQW